MRLRLRLIPAGAAAGLLSQKTSEPNMNTLTRCAAALSLCLAFVATPAFAETPREEKWEHPRIAKAIHELEDAVAYLEAAPHDFGGHKAAAIENSRRAIEELRAALQYRAREDTKRGK
jgi:hypothetical protein